MTFEHHHIWVAKLHSDEPLRFVNRERYRVIVEVKTVINVGEILRQLKLYTEYVKGARLVLVSTVPVTSLEHEALIDEGVVVMVFGQSFDRWKVDNKHVKRLCLYSAQPVLLSLSQSTPVQLKHTTFSNYCENSSPTSR